MEPSYEIGSTVRSLVFRLIGVLNPITMDYQYPLCFPIVSVTYLDFGIGHRVALFLVSQKRFWVTLLLTYL